MAAWEVLSCADAVCPDARVVWLNVVTGLFLRIELKSRDSTWTEREKKPRVNRTNHVQVGN